MINVKPYHSRCVRILPIWFLDCNINIWEIITSKLHSFTVWQFMLGWWICTHFFHGHIRCCFLYMAPMRHDRVLYVSNRQLAISPDLIFVHFDLYLWVSSNNDPAMIIKTNTSYFIYELLTTTHDFVPCRHILQLGWQDFM